MRKYTFVFAALVAVLFAGVGTASAQSLSHSSVVVRGGSVGASFSAVSGNYRGNHTSVGVNIGIGGPGGYIGIHTGNRGGWDRGHGGWDRGRGGWDRGGWDRRGPVYRGPVYRYPAPVYRGPVYRDPCGYGYDYGCGGSSTVTVRVWDGYGYVLYTAWYDYDCGCYVYRDRYGNLRSVR